MHPPSWELSCFAALTSGKSFTSGSSLYPIATPSCFCSTPQFSSVHFSSVPQSCPTLATPWTVACKPPCPSPIPGVYSISYPLSQWCHPPSHPLSSPSPPAISLFQYQGLFKWIRSSHQVAKLSFSFNISPSNEHPGLISFRMDWLDIFAVQGTLRSLLQHHSSKASIFRCSAFFIVQLLHSYMTTGQTIALTRWTFVGKVISLLFNMLSSLVITFLPKSKCLLISWLY